MMLCNKLVILTFIIFFIPNYDPFLTFSPHKKKKEKKEDLLSFCGVRKLSVKFLLLCSLQNQFLLLINTQSSYLEFFTQINLQTLPQTYTQRLVKKDTKNNNNNVGFTSQKIKHMGFQFTSIYPKEAENI